jgi:hypothetical protein
MEHLERYDIPFQVYDDTVEEDSGVANLLFSTDTTTLSGYEEMTELSYTTSRDTSSSETTTTELADNMSAARSIALLEEPYLDLYDDEKPHPWSEEPRYIPTTNQLYVENNDVLSSQCQYLDPVILTQSQQTFIAVPTPSPANNQLTYPPPLSLSPSDQEPTSQQESIPNTQQQQRNKVKRQRRSRNSEPISCDRCGKQFDLPWELQ